MFRERWDKVRARWFVTTVSLRDDIRLCFSGWLLPWHSRVFIQLADCPLPRLSSFPDAPRLFIINCRATRYREERVRSGLDISVCLWYLTLIAEDPWSAEPGTIKPVVESERPLHRVFCEITSPVSSIHKAIASLVSKCIYKGIASLVSKHVHKAILRLWANISIKPSHRLWANISIELSHRLREHISIKLSHRLWANIFIKVSHRLWANIFIKLSHRLWANVWTLFDNI